MMKLEFRNGMTVQVHPMAPVTVRMLPDGVLEITPRQARATRRRLLNSVLTMLVVAGAVGIGYLAHMSLSEGDPTYAATNAPVPQNQAGANVDRPSAATAPSFYVPIPRYGEAQQLGRVPQQLIVPEPGEMPPRSAPPSSPPTAPQSPFGLDAP